MICVYAHIDMALKWSLILFIFGGDIVYAPLGTSNWWNITSETLVLFDFDKWP